MAVNEKVLIGDAAEYPHVVMGYTRTGDGPSETFFVRVGGSLVWSRDAFDVTGTEPWKEYDRVVEQKLINDIYDAARKQAARAVATYRAGAKRHERRG